jgi:hypothetical protein
MKSINNILFITLAALFLQGCMANSGTNKKSSTVIKSTTTSPVSPVFATDEALYWFTTQKVTGTVTVNLNSDSVIFLRGSSIHTFLTGLDSSNVPNYQRQYCIIANYGTSYRQLRVRGVPVAITNSTTKAIERVLRLDLPSEEENLSTCGTTTIDTINPLTTSPDKTVAYSIKNLCFASGCLGATVVSSNTLKIYTSSTMVQVSTNKINITPVTLKLDLQSNSTTPDNSCSNSSCSAKGFDCCSEGQCVKDASLRSSAESNIQYSQAMNDYALNPLSFINYPNIFNICSNISHTPPVVTPPGNTPLTDAQIRVQTYIADYQCIEQVLSGGTYSQCLPGKLVADFNTTKRRLAISCGCPAAYTNEEVLAKCPDWGVRPLYSSSVETIANIVDFYCYTPSPTSSVGPITNLNVSVPSRSAPHRFYATTGTSYDDVSKLASTVIQEGDDFYYQDEVNKMSPVNNKFNMNSIMGRMNVGLTQTQPAKMVAVELGQTYVLTTTSGYFTPCSQCAKDSWFQNFSAHPSTSGGVGLRATGFTTSRDLFSSNTTYGNYEDTHFGRACYLPATMIPFSHMKNGTIQAQRLNRLKTQASFYVNGYQKDWYGFNKGAMIGSFDGVKWFAIGSGRRVSATSAKLYLAINGAFQDLATKTDIIVNIIPDSGNSVVPEYDYDPTLSFTDVKQNSAASCQMYHQCSTDTDCVAQLGWEYSCAEVAQMRTKWPAFDSSANELANQETSGNIFEILQGTTNPGESTKRCVYRGAGAPCVRNFTTLNGKVNQKALTCAPNFYCAALTSNKFNDELVRSPFEMDNILFGMDANVLGRPLKYVTASKTLSAEVISNIKNSGGNGSLGLSTAEIDDMGICRPGKSLSSDPATAHSNPDTNKRTDFISQVGSCDSALNTISRTVSCPAIGDDLNYVYTATSADNILRQMQNSCGGDSKNTDSPFTSAFKNIEAGSLQLLTIISQKTLVADACYRRAGSVCHTDLDCSPNKMHEEATNSLNLAYFGGTEAEQNYWKEALTCGQGAGTPTLGTTAYTNYKLSENRCCREIGKDFTMYTTGPSTIIPENLGSNVNLSTSTFASANPTAANRYSRYAVSKTAVATPAAIPKVDTATIPAANQWKVINETGSQTCCGGGWVRKFSDGTHDWKIKNRLNIDTTNFSCLNYRSPLVSSNFNNFAKINEAAYQREYENFCKWPSYNGCMQILYNDIVDETTITPPIIYNPSAVENVGADNGPAITPPAYAIAIPYGTAYSSLPTAGRTRLDTAPVGDISAGYIKKHTRDAPYQPFAFYFPQYPFDLYTHTDTGVKEAFNFFIDKDTDYGVSMYVPAYIPLSGFSFAVPNSGATTQIYIKYYFDDGRQEVVNITDMTSATCSSVINYPAGSAGMPVDAMGAGTNEAWCITANTNTQNRPVLNVKAYTGAAANRQWSYASVVIDFVPYEKLDTTDPVTVPGSMAYYLTKLARLELIGIPQITYEPIYCNSNQNLLVPGIFSSDITSRTEFELDTNSFVGYNSTVSYTYNSDGVNKSDAGVVGNSSKRMTFQDKLSHSAVFSSKDFTCCTPLGKETASAGKCCSAAASTGSDGKLTCKLPSGADLNVYFNKFVSNEGVGETLPLGGLIANSKVEDDIDFNQRTGEPKARTKTFQKLLELGKIYCQSGIVKNGSVFAKFESEPNSGYNSYENADAIDHPVSIMDSLSDKTQDLFSFDSGFRWNNHYYCK